MIKITINSPSQHLYTTNLTETPESTVNRSIIQTFDNLYPNALLSHRSALEYKPTETGNVLLTYT